jgi:hypothetical protein
MARGHTERREARRSARDDRHQERKADVDRKLLSLRGQSRTDLERDQERGAGSPLGAGMGSRPTKRSR